jgi:hypothetical protein
VALAVDNVTDADDSVEAESLRIAKRCGPSKVVELHLIDGNLQG